MALLVNDTFTEVGNTNLVLHTPDIGTGWTERHDSTGILNLRVRGGVGHMEADGTQGGSGIIYTSQPNPTEKDVDIELDIQAIPAEGTDDPIWLIGRYADNDNYYFAGVYQSAAAADIKIYKKVSGVVTQLASGDTGIQAGDVIKFEIRDFTKKLYKNCVEILSTGDNAITAAGEAGIGMGELGQTAGDDVNTGWQCAEYNLAEFAPGAVGRASSTAVAVASNKIKVNLGIHI